MKPVLQTRVGADTGNCFQAAVASCLGVGLEDVLPQGGDWLTYLRDLDRSLGSRGLGLFTIDLVEPGLLSELGDHCVPSGYWIASIPSTLADCWHAVVCRERAVAHDPEQHPGVPADPLVGGITVFVALDAEAAA